MNPHKKLLKLLITQSHPIFVLYRLTKIINIFDQINKIAKLKNYPCNIFWSFIFIDNSTFLNILRLWNLSSFLSLAFFIKFFCRALQVLLLIEFFLQNLQYYLQFKSFHNFSWLWKSKLFCASQNRHAAKEISSPFFCKKNVNVFWFSVKLILYF